MNRWLPALAVAMVVEFWPCVYAVADDSGAGAPPWRFGKHDHRFGRESCYAQERMARGTLEGTAMSVWYQNGVYRFRGFGLVPNAGYWIMYYFSPGRRVRSRAYQRVALRRLCNTGSSGRCEVEIDLARVKSSADVDHLRIASLDLIVVSTFSEGVSPAPSSVILTPHNIASCEVMGAR